jgi:hypothetical protein
MSHRDRSQPRILLLAVELNLTFENASRRRTAQGLVRLIDRGQKLDVGPRVALGETAPPIHGWLHAAGCCVAADQPRNLRPAQPGHLRHVAAQQASHRLALSGVLLRDHHSLHPAVDLLTIFALKPDFLACLNESPNPFQTQLLCFVHADVQSPACLILQAHLVLEESQRRESECL